MERYTMLTNSQIHAEIDKRCVRYAKSVHVYQTLHECLKKFEGKKITKRLATAAERALGVRVYYNTNHGMYHLEIAVDGNWQDKFSFLIAYSSDPTYTTKKFEDYCRCYALDVDRKEALEKGKSHVADLVEKWNCAVLALNAVVAEAEVYGLEYEFKL